MPRRRHPKTSPTKDLKLNLARDYRGMYNSPTELAKAYGVSRRTIERWINTVSNDEEPIKSAERARDILARRRQAAVFFQGDKSMKQTFFSPGGKRATFVRQEFKIEPGASLPQNELTQKGHFQIRVRGKVGSKVRGITSVVSETPEMAMNSLRKELAKYARFKGYEAYVMVYTRKSILSGSTLSELEGYDEPPDEWTDEWEEEAGEDFPEDIDF